MSFGEMSIESLQEKIRTVEGELERRNQHISRLEKENKALSQRVQEASETQQQSASEISEMEETLKRMVVRVAMITQASKCLFLIHDSESKELFADPPAHGFDEEQIKSFRIPIEGTVAGDCFRENKPQIIYDAESDDRASRENLASLGVKNGLCVPLIVERRDEETGKVLDRRTIGVLYVFNKRFGGVFVNEDVQLLARMAQGTASIINMAESYRQIVKERDEVIETIESLSMGLIMVSKTGRIAQMNNSALRVFGLKREEIGGGKTYEAVIQDEKAVDLIRRAIADEVDLGEEISLPDREAPEGSPRVFQLQSAQVRTEGGDSIGTAIILNDITQIKNVDKMKTAFVSTVSHELRTPLTSIKGFVATLVQDTEGYYDADTRHEFYTIIDDQCDRLKRLIDDLLSISRIEAGNALELNVGDVNLRQIVETAMRIQESSTSKKENHTLSFEIAPEVPPQIQGDGDKVEQILANLVSNALKYSPGGGNVAVKAKMMASDMVEFAVSDQGMGIPPEHLSKMGERFHRVDNRDTRTIGGTGIGLFLVKHLVEIHGGKMWIDSEVGKGSVFHFSLPTTQPDEITGENLSQRVAG
ncbi:MAG: GAF domain-containing protein [Akkermansiaceae bacterium]|nr:GAF domain-containing protein [Armatimonadota bacterium]